VKPEKMQIGATKKVEEGEALWCRRRVFAGCPPLGAARQSLIVAQMLELATVSSRVLIGVVRVPGPQTLVETYKNAGTAYIQR
jgi:hypothetical protein